jgi:5-methyltetrahydropteroyltriglutamate--homocysteine methyltransferase
MSEAYRADQVGSLLRPPELLRAREEFAAGRLDAGGLREVEDRAILEALAGQRNAGVDVLTDGELRRQAWMTDMAEAVDGFVAQSTVIQWKGPGGRAEPSFSHVVGDRLRPRRRLTETQARFLKAHASGPCKVTLPSPSAFLMTSYEPGLSDRAYPTRADMLRDLSAIVRDELAALAADGIAYLQLDTPGYAMYFCDPTIRAGLPARGVDPEAALRLAVEADNASLEGLDRSRVTVGLHICRGNSRSRWAAEGGYEPIAETVFGGLRVDRLLLEYDSERAGGFEPLRFVPDRTTVVLGLVTTKSPQLESRDQLARRIEEASRYVPLERLAVSPQCGFASVAAGNLLSLDDQWRKLELVAETARLVWS